MPEKKFTLLHTHDTLELYCTLYPFIVSKYSRHVNFHYFPNQLTSTRNHPVLFTRIFKGRFDDTQFINQTLDQLKTSFSSIHFLDDNAGADSFHFEFIDRLGSYYKGKLPVDLSTSEKSLYGRQIFSDHYNNELGIMDYNDESIREPLSDLSQLKKVKPAFNLGYGLYPLPSNGSLIRKTTYGLFKINRINYLKPYILYEHQKQIRQLSQKKEYSKKRLKVSARFRYSGYPNSIAYQRKLMEQLASGKSAFLTGLIPRDQYLKELSEVFVTLSPFGYGEVCLRDFEAILNGSLLIKPDMSHMKSFPNIYIPDETYIPVKWDGSDLLDKVDDILSNPKSYTHIIESAREVYRNALIKIDMHVEERFNSLLN